MNNLDLRECTAQGLYDIELTTVKVQTYSG
jgi:hypothetical protein